MKTKHWIAAGFGVGALALAASLAVSQQISVPLVTGIAANDLFQDVVGGFPQAPTYYATATQIGNYGATLPGNNPENALIGGDSTTNLYQRGTTGSSVTTTVTYGGPDRWAYWSGTSTAMTVSQDTTAADLPTAAAGYRSAFKMARTSGQTGVVQVCMAQEVESANSYAFAGQTAEVDFYAAPGTNFSAANGVMTAYVITGTGADEGMQKLAWGLNAGGGGSTGWAGQVNTGVTVTIGTNNVSNRYSVVAPVPTTATEIGVALCFTPVGTAGTNDYIAFAGIQLTRNNALAGVAGTAGAALNVNDGRAKAFARRSQQQETALQQRYFYQINETNGTVYGTGICQASGVARVPIYPPVTMRATPTGTITVGGFSVSLAGAAVTAATTPTITVSTTQVVNFTAANACTAANTVGLIGTNTTGVIPLSAEL